MNLMLIILTFNGTVSVAVDHVGGRDSKTKIK